ncbi:MAG: hypothetical protein U1F61_16970 [Opitutaceae bacterium]
MRPPLESLVAIAFTFLGLASHLWAGWADEHRLIFRPVGHWTVLSVFVWLIAFLAALVGVVANRGFRTWGSCCLVLSSLGLFLLFSR